MRRPNSLAFRLFVAAAVWSLLVLPVTAFLLSSLNRGAVERSFDGRLGSLLKNLIGNSIKSGTGQPEAPGNIGDSNFNLPYSGWYWQISERNGDGKVLFASDSLLTDRLTLPSEKGAEPDDNRIWRAYVTGPDGEQLRVLEQVTSVTGLTAPRSAEPEAKQYVFAVAGNAEQIERDVADFTMLLTAALAVLGIGLAVATWFQVRYGLRPLQEISQSLAAIRSGRAERLEGRFPTEIVPLAHELNALIQSNKDVIERARTQVGNLAHALKTPLSVITNEARAEDGVLAKKVTEQAELMRNQVTHYLDRARVAAKVGVIGAVTDVAPVVAALERALSRIYQERGLQLESRCPQDAKFLGEKHDLEELVGNLMDNACKWATARVVLTVEHRPDPEGETPGTLHITVDDDGPGMTPEQCAEAMRRGQRLDESQPGTGLGLSIVADLAHLYRGSFELGRAPSGGLRAELTLPAA